MKSNVLPGTMVGVALLLACGSGASDSQSDTRAAETSGGYTGLGKYVETSGVYGNGVSSSGGAETDASATASGVGGRGDVSNGGVVGVVRIAGGAPATLNTSPTSGASGTFGGNPSVGGLGSTARSSSGAVSTGGSTTAATTVIGPTGGRVSSGGRTGGAPIATGGTTVGGATTSFSSAGAAPRASGGAVVANGGTNTAPSTFAWPSAYDPAGVASNPSGKHNPGSNCMGSGCHASTQPTRAFAFGGTVYQPDGTTAAANVQIAVVSGSTVVTVYSATNGNFWLPLANATSIDWAKATVHLRNGKGEIAKPPDTTLTAACNSCHGSAMRITAP